MLCFPLHDHPLTINGLTRLFFLSREELWWESWHLFLRHHALRGKQINESATKNLIRFQKVFHKFLFISDYIYQNFVSLTLHYLLDTSNHSFHMKTVIIKHNRFQPTDECVALSGSWLVCWPLWSSQKRSCSWFASVLQKLYSKEIAVHHSQWDNLWPSSAVAHLFLTALNGVCGCSTLLLPTGS